MRNVVLLLVYDRDKMYTIPIYCKSMTFYVPFHAYTSAKYTVSTFVSL